MNVINSIKTKIKGNGNKLTKGEKVAHAVFFVIFLIEALSLLSIFVWMGINSLKEWNEYEIDSTFTFPKKAMWSNYVQAFRDLNDADTSFFGLIFNSVWYTVAYSVLGALVPAFTGYILSKYDFKLRSLIFTTAITSMMVPIVGNTASNLKLIGELQLYNSPLYVFITGLGGFGGTFLVYYGFFKNVSWSYAEAVQIDGGGDYTILFRIMLPQAAPIILTYIITGAIAGWNDYETMILYTPKLPTLASGLYSFQANNMRSLNYPVYIAGLLISMVPSVALFAAFANKIMTSISLGGLKG